MKATKGILQINEIDISKSAKAQKDNSIIPMIIGGLIILSIIGCSMIAELFHLI